MAWRHGRKYTDQTFFKALRKQENVAIDSGRLEDEQRLSRSMQQSWESGDFWVTYAAKKGFTFDALF